MLEGRIISELLLLPNGEVMIVNGAKTGYPAYGSVQHAINNISSNADHPAWVSLLGSNTLLMRAVGSLHLSTNPTRR
jgi:hypothetical protein